MRWFMPISLISLYSVYKYLKDQPVHEQISIVAYDKLIIA